MFKESGGEHAKDVSSTKNISFPKSIAYKKDGGSSNNDLTGTWVNSTSDIKTLSFVPTVKANAKDCHSIKLVFNSTEATNVGADFEIHDISIVYRGRKVK